MVLDDYPVLPCILERLQWRLYSIFGYRKFPIYLGIFLFSISPKIIETYRGTQLQLSNFKQCSEFLAVGWVLLCLKSRIPFGALLNGPKNVYDFLSYASSTVPFTPCSFFTKYTQISDTLDMEHFSGRASKLEWVL